VDLEALNREREDLSKQLAGAKASRLYMMHVMLNMSRDRWNHGANKEDRGGRLSGLGRGGCGPWCRSCHSVSA
jgi:hypothetical protein